MTAYSPALGSMTHHDFVYDALPSEWPAITNYYLCVVCTACKKPMLLKNMHPFGSAMSGRTQLLISKAGASNLICTKTRWDLKINIFIERRGAHNVCLFKSIASLFRQSRPQMVSAVA
jgi:hypothetical protein